MLVAYTLGGLALGVLDAVFRAATSGLGFPEHLGTRANIWGFVCIWVAYLAAVHPRVRALVAGAVLMCVGFVVGLVVVPTNVARWGFVELLSSAGVVMGASLAGYLVVGGVSLALARWAGRVVAPRDLNRCERCDYPLIGLPGPRCPECGTPFAAAGGSTGGQDG